jgi:archaetidylinositol phosphate synthase
MHVWRERLARWFTPLATRCPLSPNVISSLALTANLAAATLLYFRQFLPAMVVIALAGLADAFDGIVARVQGKASRYGDFLDHVFDRLSDTAIAAGWMLGSGVRPELTVAGTVVVMLNGYVGTQIEATWQERSYEGVGRGEFVLALIVFPIVSHILQTNGWNARAWAGLTIAEWLTLLLIAFALLGIVQRFARAARLERSR